MIHVSVMDHASGPLRAYLRQVANPIPGLMVAGRAVRNVLVRHYRAKDKAEPNKLGGRRTHFWLEIARSVHVPVQTGTNEVTVGIGDPRIGQKVHGGVITAKRAGALTIPIHAEAHGRAASVLERVLGITLFRIGKKGLVGYGSILAGVWRGKLTKFYALRKQTRRQEPTPGALPEQNVMGAEAAKAMEGWMVREKARAKV